MRAKEFFFFVGALAILIVLCFVCYVAVMETRFNPEAEEQKNHVTVLKNQIVIENLKLQQEQERQRTATLKAKLSKEQQKFEQDAKIQARPEVEESRALLVRFRYVLPVYGTVFFAACAVVGGLVFAFTRRTTIVTPFVTVALPVRKASAIVEKSLTVSNASELAKATAFTEEISRARLSDSISLAKALRAGREMFTIHNEQAALPAAEETHAEFTLPTMRELYEHLQPGDELVLGYESESGNAVTGNFEQLYSGGTFGESGSGKSAWLRALVTQPVLCYPQSKFYIVDQHYAHKQSLTNTLPRIENYVFVDMWKPEKQLADFTREFDRRVRQGEEALDRPHVLVVDELKGIRKKPWFPKLMELMERIPTEGRKFGVYMLISTQDCRVKTGFDFRDTLTSLYAFKNKPKQLHTLLQDSDKVQQMKKITQSGMALFEPTEGEPMIVKLPFCAPADMTYFAQEYRVRQANGRDVSVTDTGDDTLETPPDTPEITSKHAVLDAALKVFKNDKQALADAAGISFSLVRQMESGAKNITDTTLQKLQKVLDNAETGQHNVIQFPQR